MSTDENDHADVRLWGPWAGHPEVVNGRWNGRGDLTLELDRTVDEASPLTDDDWDYVPCTMDPNEAQLGGRSRVHDRRRPTQRVGAAKHVSLTPS